MAHFLASNLTWILLGGVVLYLYFGRRHGGHMGGMGGRGGGQSGHQGEPVHHDEQVHPGEPHEQHPDRDMAPQAPITRDSGVVLLCRRGAGG